LKYDVGIARTLKTQEIIFMYKKISHFGRDLTRIYVMIHNKNKLLACLSQWNKIEI